MVSTRSGARLVTLPVHKKRSRVHHSKALPQVTQGHTGRSRTALQKIALRGSRKRTATANKRTRLHKANGSRITATINSAGHAAAAARGVRRLARHRHRHAARKSRPTHVPRPGADRRKQSSYCLRKYKRN